MQQRTIIKWHTRLLQTLTCLLNSFDTLGIVKMLIELSFPWSSFHKAFDFKSLLAADLPTNCLNYDLIANHSVVILIVDDHPSSLHQILFDMRIPLPTQWRQGSRKLHLINYNNTGFLHLGRNNSRNVSRSLCNSSHISNIVREKLLIYYLRTGVSTYNHLFVFFSFISALMCHRTTCPKCNKPTWSGCGNHVESALQGVLLSEYRYE